MSDNVSCPFCGAKPHPVTGSPRLRHPKSEQCCLVDFELYADVWSMRPPQKEQPAPPQMTSEVEWLRGLVDKLLEKQVLHVPLVKEPPTSTFPSRPDVEWK